MKKVPVQVPVRSFAQVLCPVCFSTEVALKFKNCFSTSYLSVKKKKTTQLYSNIAEGFLCT